MSEPIAEPLDLRAVLDSELASGKAIDAEATSDQQPPAGGCFVKLPTAVMSRLDIGSTAKLVYALLLDIGRRKHDVFPGVRYMANRLGVDVKAVLRAVPQLVEAKLVTIKQERGTANRYELSSLGSVGETGALAKRERSRNGTRSVGETGAEVCPKRPRIQKRASIKREEDAPLASAKAAEDSWEAARAAMTGTALDTATFKAAWESWAQYRRETRKRLTESTVKAQISKLEGLGHDRAIETIKHTIESGWTGLYPPHGDSRAAQSSPARLRAAEGKYARVEAEAKRRACE